MSAIFTLLIIDRLRVALRNNVIKNINNIGKLFLKNHLRQHFSSQLCASLQKATTFLLLISSYFIHFGKQSSNKKLYPTSHFSRS